jgi:hypothetical protein
MGFTGSRLLPSHASTAAVFRDKNDAALYGARHPDL